MIGNLTRGRSDRDSRSFRLINIRFVLDLLENDIGDSCIKIGLLGQGRSDKENKLTRMNNLMYKVSLTDPDTGGF